MEHWFIGQGYEDHLVTQEADIPEVDRVQWRKIDGQFCSVLWQSVESKILLHLRAYKTCFKFWNQAKGLYRNDIQRLYKVASSIVNVRQQDMDLSTYIGQIASLKEEFFTMMPLTTDVGDQRTQIDKFFMVLTLIGLRPDLEMVRNQILGSSFVPSLDDVFARLLRISSTQTLPFDNTSDSSSYMGGLPSLPTWLSHLILSRLSLRAPPHLRTGNASACLTHTSSLRPWILDSGASDHISGNKDFFSSITTTSALPTVTLPNGSQTVAKGICLAHPLPSLHLTSDRSTGKTIGIGRESQGLYHLTSPSTPAVCISTDAPLLIHSCLGHPSLSNAFSPTSSLSSRHRVAVPPSLAEVPADSLPIPSASPAPALPPSTNLPIALRKVGCRWVYIVKVGPDGQVDCLKAHLVAKGEVWFSVQVTPFSICLKQSPRAWFSRFSSVVQEFGGDQNGIQKLKQHLFTHFQTKDLGKLKYFLGIEIAQSNTPMDPNVKLIPRQGEPLRDPGRYRRLVGKLNYLTITCPDISFPHTRPRCVVQEQRSYPVARSSAEVEYRAMALATCELIWLKHLLWELRFGKDEQMKLICDNQATLHITSNPVSMKRLNTLKLTVTSLKRRSHQDV
ncbi:hypothetical protein CK203_055211 [Vitis vinifera]|uniref:Retrovirus-related Pol polyprotein from transposon TNT 1-94-like beta-barrel domain-containing protein n=1 Tax=Vitis vinifera TaxID=29760 RepID=A0A438GHV1_VITVI|nr:hypothetical protein CK203_055211 [Vitis vinifera]